jgi:hypothetical protein
MGGVRAVENDVACLLWIGPFASGLANQDRPSSKCGLVTYTSRAGLAEAGDPNSISRSLFPAVDAAGETHPAGL